LLLSAAQICLVVVVLTHIAERFDLLPAMGWGLPDSPGHYLNLVSAVLGIVLLGSSLIAYAIKRDHSAG
jgi:hypothetical protein